MRFPYRAAAIGCALALAACGAPQSELAQLAPIADASASVEALPTVAAPAPEPIARADIGREYARAVTRAAHRYDFARQQCEAYAGEARTSCLMEADAAFNADRAAAHGARSVALASAD